MVSSSNSNKKKSINSNKGSKSNKPGPKSGKSKTISTIIGLKSSSNDLSNRTPRKINQDDIYQASNKKIKLGKFSNPEACFNHEMIEHDANFKSSSKNFDLIEVDLSRFSTGDLKLKEKYFEDKLRDLNDKLGKLRDVAISIDRKKSIETELKENEMNESVRHFLSKYLNELEKLDQESNDKLNGLKEWHRREIEEIDETFKLENKKAVQEFHEKRKELKESLKIEHEEKRKKVETDLNMLEINFDYFENKIFPTRKLRRRTNHVNTPNYDFLVDASSLDILY